MIRAHLISSCPFFGGAARAAFRLHEALNGVGVESRWIDAGGGAPARPDVERISKPKLQRRSLWMRLSGRGDFRRYQRPFVGAHTFSTWPEGWGGPNVLLRGEAPDVYHLHWVGDFIDWKTVLPAMAAKAPLVWSLHDLNPTQGVWHYDPHDDERNKQRDALDQAAFELKRSALAAVPADRLVFVAPSRWMADRCRASKLTQRFAVEHIPYGIDTVAFSPVDKGAARTALGLSADRPVVGFVADTLGDRRKGISVLQAALGKLTARQGAVLIAIGSGAVPVDLGAEVVTLGPVREDRLLRLFYSACDVFVCPSLQDNLPNTILEAMACGTPVVGSRTGGIPDMIEEGANGWLAEPANADALAVALSQALADRGKLAEAGARSRSRVLAEFTLKIQADRHAALYRRLCHG